MNQTDLLMLAVGVITSFIVGLIVSRLYSSRRKLQFIIKTKSFDLQKYGVNELKITYNDEELSTLSVTDLIIRNSGNRTIEGIDIAKNDKLAINVAKKTKFYHFNIKTSNLANNVTINSPNDLKKEISFDYLDKRDEVHVELFHDATENNISLSGKIKNCRLIQSNTRYPYLRYVKNTIMSVLFLFVGIVALCSPAKVDSSNQMNVIGVGIFFCISSVICLSLVGHDIWNVYRINRKLNKKASKQ